MRWMIQRERLRHPGLKPQTAKTTTPTLWNKVGKLEGFLNHFAHEGRRFSKKGGSYSSKLERTLSALLNKGASIQDVWWESDPLTGSPLNPSKYVCP